MSKSQLSRAEPMTISMPDGQVGGEALAAVAAVRTAEVAARMATEAGAQLLAGFSALVREREARSDALVEAHASIIVLEREKASLLAKLEASEADILRREKEDAERWPIRAVETVDRHLGTLVSLWAHADAQRRAVGEMTTDELAQVGTGMVMVASGAVDAATAGAALRGRFGVDAIARVRAACDAALAGSC